MTDYMPGARSISVRHDLQLRIAYRIQMTVYDRVLRDGESASEREQRCMVAAYEAIQCVADTMLNNAIGHVP